MEGSEPRTDVPFTYSCRYPSSNLTSWFDQDGGLITQPFAGRPLEALAPSTGLYALVTIGPGTPAGWPFSLSVVDGGNLIPITSEFGYEYYFRLHELGGRLMIATWPDEIVSGNNCPACQIRALVAQYICAPQ